MTRACSDGRDLNSEGSIENRLWENRCQNAPPATICLLDQDSTTLQRKSHLLEKCGWQVRPFSSRDTFIEYARIHSPDAALVDFGGSTASGLETAARIKEVSPKTAVGIALKVHEPGRVPCSRG